MPTETPEGPKAIVPLLELGPELRKKGLIRPFSVPHKALKRALYGPLTRPTVRPEMAKLDQQILKNPEISRSTCREMRVSSLIVPYSPDLFLRYRTYSVTRPFLFRKRTVVFRKWQFSVFRKRLVLFRKRFIYR